MDEIINRVKKSPLVSIDLEDYLDKSERLSFDLKEGLYQEIMLREKEFRTFVADYPWDQFQSKNVIVLCSVDAIIPSWAYMLVVAKLSPYANVIAFGSENDLEKLLIDQAIEKILEGNLENSKVVIKGCGSIFNRDYAYFQIAKKLIPLVSSMMYGEPCSTVPVYKKK